MSNKNIDPNADHHDRMILENERIDDDPLHGTREQAERDRLVSTDGHIVAPDNGREGARVSNQYVDTDGRVISDDNMVTADRERIIDDNARRMAGQEPIVDGDRAAVRQDRVVATDPDVTDARVVRDNDAIDRHEVKNMSHESKEDLNADMITGEPGSHPIGTGIGGVGGAAAGMAIGTMAGPLGTLIGGAIGAVVGGGAGHAAAEAIDPTREEAYWRAEHANTNYYQDGYDFDRDLHPAYAVGYANRARYPADARFEDHEADLRRSWDEVKGESRMAWDDARLASRDAWNRVS